MRAHRCLGLLLGCLVATSSSACRRAADDVPCSAVATRLLVVAQTEMKAAAVDETLRQRVALQLPALRDAVDGACARGDWAMSVRRCMVAAVDGAALAACQRELTLQQRAELDGATAQPAKP